MGYRSTINILIALFLVLGITADSALAEACFCGQVCSRVLQPKEKAKLSFLFHARCPDTLCKSCDLEKGKALKGANPSAAIIDFKILGTQLSISTTLDYHSYGYALNFSSLFYFHGKLPSSPIYLQNLSLRC